MEHEVKDRKSRPEKIELKGVPIVISAPSGAGKTTVCKLLSKNFKNIEYSVSATTRPPRKNESTGISYIFLTRAEFSEWIKKGHFLEWAKVHNHYYGTPKRKFEETLKKGSNIIMDIDVQGALKIKNKYPSGIYIFILTKNAKILKKRLAQRKTDSEQSMKKRINNARWELRFVNEYNYIVINDTIKKTVAIITNILIAETCVTIRNSQVIKKFKKNL